MSSCWGLGSLTALLLFWSGFLSIAGIKHVVGSVKERKREMGGERGEGERDRGGEREEGGRVEEMGRPTEMIKRKMKEVRIE